jgi:hypothetical protein
VPTQQGSAAPTAPREQAEVGDGCVVEPSKVIRFIDESVQAPEPITTSRSASFS